MGLLFISHSSRDNAEAVAMRDWLASQGWREVFLDLDPSGGLAPGQRWREELRKAGEHCSGRWCTNPGACEASHGALAQSCRGNWRRGPD